MNPNFKYSSAGIWVPVAASYVSATNYGQLANMFTALIPLGAPGKYGFVISGWGFPQPDPATPEQVSMGLFAAQADGTVALATSTYISDAVTWGSGSALVADFNGDGRADIVLVAHNEQPFVAEPGYAYMANGSGGFDKVTLPGLTLAHDAELTRIDGQLAVTTATFSPGDQNPIYTFTNGAYELVRSDVAFTFLGPGRPGDSTIAIYGFNDAGLTLTPNAQAPIQKITPYLSTLPQYASYNGQRGVGLTHANRLWTDDLNHDGHPDLLVAESMWNPALPDYPTALQVLINKGDGTFRDATTTLNPSMSLNTDLLDYSPTFIDLDHSGINSYLMGNYSAQGAARQANYLLLNDGTGHIYVALHDQFAQWDTQALAFLHQAYPDVNGTHVTSDPNYFAKFIGVPQADGSVNFVAQFTMSILDPASSQFHTEYVFANVPVAYNPATDFTQNVTIADRNGSSLMRTWAGNDTFYDTNSAASAHIDGGLGSNTAIYSGALSHYTVQENADGSVVVKALGSGAPQINDTLIHVQTLKFADTTVNLPGAPGSGVTLVFDLHSAQDSLVYEIYQAAYGRTPDNAGFRYWAGVADATNMSSTVIADQFLAAPEFSQLYGANPSNTTYVTGLYTHVLGRTPDPGGLAYWVGQANAGLARDALLVAFATSGENAALIGSHVANGYWTT